jgi:hypothetical protein
MSAQNISPSKRILKHFRYDHLPVHLQAVSKPICELAEKMTEDLLESAEKKTGLRKLLEAKDCFVRAYLEDFQKE